MKHAVRILARAAELVGGDRNRQHGDPHENFGLIARYWSVLFGIEIPAWKVARAMELVKIARDQSGEPNDDNAVDGAGYSALAGTLRKPPCAVNAVKERGSSRRRR
jgi:hypothetical protein